MLLNPYFGKYESTMQMIALVYPMGMVLFSWLLFFLLFSGLGFVLLKWMNQTPAWGLLWLDSFWLGWAFSLVALQLWHFAFPVNEVILLLLALAALAGLWMQRHHIFLMAGRLKQYPLFSLIFALFLLWMSNRAIDMPTAFDTGYRDIQAIMWIDAYPIVPGLNNLFSSLAYNHSVYLYDALLDVSFWDGRSYHIATGLLLMAFLAYAIRGATQLYRHRDGAGIRWSWIFATLMIPYILFYTVRRGGINHFLTDTRVDLIGFLALIYLLDFLQNDRSAQSSSRYLIFRLAILILTGFTVKQSFIVFGLGIGGLVWIVWLRRGGFRAGIKPFAQIMIPILLFALLIMIPWMARGLVYSGYVAYPQSFGRVEVDWVEPQESLARRQRQLATNTRIRYGDPEVVLASWDWVMRWFQSFSDNMFAFVLPTVLSGAALGLYGCGRWRHRWTKRKPPLGLWILLPLLLMMAVWFLTAPNIKYVRYVLWSHAALLVILAALAWPSLPQRLRIYGIYAVLALCLGYVLVLMVRLPTLPLPAGPEDGFYAHAMPPIQVYETNTGLKLNVPNSHIRQCWQIPLPCTPYPHPGIYARAPGEMRHGFGSAPENKIDAGNG